MTYEEMAAKLVSEGILDTAWAEGPSIMGLHDGLHIIADDFEESLPFDPKDQSGWCVGVYESQMHSECIGDQSSEDDTSYECLVRLINDGITDAAAHLHNC